MLLSPQAAGNVAVVALAFSMAAYELWLWRLRQAAPETHLWGGLLALVMGIYTALHAVQWEVADPSTLGVLARLATLGMLGLCLLIVEYGEAISGELMPLSRMARGSIAVPLAGIIILGDIVTEEVVAQPMWFGATFHTVQATLAWEIIAGALILATLAAVLWLLARSERPELHRLLGPGLLVLLLAASHDLLVYTLRLETYGYLLQVGFLAWAMAALALDVKTYASLFDQISAERKRWKEVAATQRQAFRDLFENAPLPVLVVRDGEVAYANQSATRSLGARDVEGPVLSWVDETHREEAAARWLGAEPSEGSVEIAMRPSDDAVSYWETQAFRVPFDDAQAVAVFARDITERKEILAKTMTLDRMVAAGTLAAGVAHEINNPLTFITFNLDYACGLLDGGALDEASTVDLREAIEESLAGAQRVRDIVQDLGRLARPEVQVGEVELSEVIASAARMIHSEARHRARLELELEAVSVNGDGSRLGQVFLNLLLNAVQAIPVGNSEQDEVRVTVDVDEEFVVVCVRDTGPGIPPDVLPRIFDPFFTTKPVGEGTGLGLAICRETVVASGGELTVESEVGRGTAFFVRLPRRLAAAPPASSAPPASRPALRRRVLVVDDEVSVCRAIERMIGDRYDIVSATSGERAFRLLEDGAHFDAVVCDVMMPVTTGREVYQRVCELAPDLADRMVFISGGVFGDLEPWLDDLAHPFLAKPFAAKDLVAALEGACRAAPTRALTG